jgi:hypothetical protein
LECGTPVPLWNGKVNRRQQSKQRKWGKERSRLLCFLRVLL